jgi:hypothetical protein
MLSISFPVFIFHMVYLGYIFLSVSNISTPDTDHGL